MISFTNGYFGWLGNQMFQYATTYALSRRTNTSCSFPENNPSLYDVFNISAEKGIQNSPMYYEETFSYTPIPTTNTHLTLHGYFQSDKYFTDFADDIRKEFTFSKKIKVPSTSMVSVHVRRGDYLNLSDYHPACTLDYYKRAMNEFNKDCNFLIFSDDKRWCLENFTKGNCKVSLNPDPAHDLQLMSLCDHHIIANSSFSWWGAWLGGNKDKTVVAPREWFGPAKKDHNTKDLYCKDWIVL